MSLLTAILAALALTLALELVFALAWGVRKEGLLVVVLMKCIMQRRRTACQKKWGQLILHLKQIRRKRTT